MGGRWNTRGAFFEIVRLKKADTESSSSGMSEREALAELLEWVLMEQVHSLERKLKSRQGLRRCTTHFIYGLLLSLAIVSMCSGC